MASLTASVKDAPSFSYRYLTGVNMITLGTELCASAAFSYLPPLLLEAGFSESGMSTVMATGPFLALFLLPVMGMASDQCRSKYGRRRPFIFILSVGIILSLILIPNTKTVTNYFGDYIPDSRFGMLVLAAGVILLDFCSQVCYTPIESLLSDPCQTEVQRNRSFSNFSLMMSTGACLGYFVVSVDWNETLFGKYLGGNQRTLFIILLVVFTSSLLISLCIARDPPFKKSVDGKPLSSPQTRVLNGTLPLQTVHTNGGTIESGSITITPKSTGRQKLLHRFAKRIVSPIQVRCAALFSCIPCPKLNILISPILDTIQGIRTMPRAMQTLWVAHLVTSTAVMGFRLYFTDYMGESIYHGNPDSPVGSMSRTAYEHGETSVT